jgi:Zn-dependent M28 family amino/carboxypeptidase
VSLSALLLVALFAGDAGAATPERRPPDDAARLVGGALLGAGGYAIVQSLTDRVGARLAGTAGAERGVAWALEQMKQVGLTRVRAEPVKFSSWQRGDTSVRLLAPREAPLHAVALGGSVPTPAGGIVAEVVEVESSDALKALGAAARGKIVLFNHPMTRTRGFEGYGEAVGLRGHGAVYAAAQGAQAALIRSVGTGSYQLPHAGGTRYDDATPKIPFLAISAEDADLIHRLLAAGEKVRVQLESSSRWIDTTSANVVGDLPGRAQPEEVVLLGAHLDSWDLGAGALDDGAGCAIVLETARLLSVLGPRRRTVRVVLYMNEENGLSGARAYAEAHKGDLARHAAAMEADGGAGRPLGFTAVGAGGLALVRRLAAPLQPLGAAQVGEGDEAGADLFPLVERGVPAVGFNQDMSTYFDWHHTAADTLDKIDPLDLSLASAAFAVMAAGLADAPERLPPPPPPKHH